MLAEDLTYKTDIESIGIVLILEELLINAFCVCLHLIDDERSSPLGPAA